MHDQEGGKPCSKKKKREGKGEGGTILRIGAKDLVRAKGCWHGLFESESCHCEDKHRGVKKERRGKGLGVTSTKIVVLQKNRLGGISTVSPLVGKKRRQKSRKRRSREGGVKKEEVSSPE